MEEKTTICFIYLFCDFHCRKKKEENLIKQPQSAIYDH